MPGTGRAYQANVPTEMTEKEFWTKYIQSAYFNRDRGAGGNASSASYSGSFDGHKRRAAEAGGATDDMFLRFAAKEAEREKAEKEGRRGGGGGGGKGVAKGGEGGKVGGRLEAGSVDPMVDLTSQWGDYHAREVRRGLLY